MSDDTLIIIVVIVIALAIIVWLLYLAAGLVLVFTAFVIELPLILSIIMFIIFPPTLIVFLVGLAFMYFGIADAMIGSDSGTPKLTERAKEREKKRRQALGYEE